MTAGFESGDRDLVLANGVILNVPPASLARASLPPAFASGGNGQVTSFTGDIVVRRGRIQAVRPTDGGSSEQDRGRSRRPLAVGSVPGASVVDLGGRPVLPGFIDSHVHLAATGHDLLAPDYGVARSSEDLLEILAEWHRAGKLPTDGGGLYGGRVPEKVVEHDGGPTRTQLDRLPLARKLPLWFNHPEYHGVFVNTAALEWLGGTGSEDSSLPDSSLLIGRKASLARCALNSLFDAAHRRRAYLAAAESASRKGVTTLHALEGGELFGEHDWPVLLELLTDLGPRVVFYWQGMDAQFAAARAWRRIGGCFLLDGSGGVHTAALSRPYRDRPETSGMLYHTAAELVSLIAPAHAAGLQVALHACGDRAIDAALDAYSALSDTSDSVAERRHRIEHFEMPRPEQVARAAALGLVLSLQPAFDFFWGGPGGDYERQLGPEAAQHANPVGAALRAGISVAGGSDSPVTPLDPLLGIHQAVNHRSIGQRVSLAAALAMFTSDGAYAAHLERETGNLAPGLAADVVVLEQDPRFVPATSIKDLRVSLTVSRGQITHPSSVRL